MAKFSMGQVVIEPAAADEAARRRVDLFELLGRHVLGDWGDLSEHDARLNDAAVISGGRIMSAYERGGVTLWVITEADRACTVITLPDSY